MSLRNSSGNDQFFVEGSSAVMEYLRHRPQAVKRVGGKAVSDDVWAAIRSHKLASAFVDTSKLSADERRDFPAAPLWAQVRLSPLQSDQFWERLKSRDRDLIIALDHITDPRNLGAVVRTAAFFGVHEVLVPRDRQVLLAPAAVSTAQGGFALTDLVVATNLSRELSRLVELGYWIVGAAGGGEDFRRYCGKYEKLVLVFGSEDKGLSTNIRKRCDCLVGIPGADASLDSLNVAVACGILTEAFAGIRSS